MVTNSSADESDQCNIEDCVVITAFPELAGEKVSHDLFERVPESRVAEELPAPDKGGIPLLEPDLDTPSVPPEVADWPWRV